MALLDRGGRGSDQNWCRSLAAGGNLISLCTVVGAVGVGAVGAVLGAVAAVGAVLFLNGERGAECSNAGSDVVLLLGEVDPSSS